MPRRSVPRAASRPHLGQTDPGPKKVAPHQRTQKPLPLDEWKVCIRDKYAAHISRGTFVTIQGMIRDNHSAYDRNKTRGVPLRKEGTIMAQGRARDEHKERQWRRWISAWRASGLSVREFCDRRGLAAPSFYSWRRTLERCAAEKAAL